MGNLGFKEKDITLNISKEIKEVLENYGAKVYLTREKDEEVLLIKRAEITNNIKPDFFLVFIWIILQIPKEKDVRYIITEKMKKVKNWALYF